MAPTPSFTLGIEEEFQVIDPQSRELKSHIHELFAEGEKRLKDEIKREMHDAVIEVGTPICQNIKEARREITRLRREIITLTGEADLAIASAGTHPISHWANVPITPHARYDQIVYELQMLARANLILPLRPRGTTRSVNATAGRRQSRNGSGCVPPRGGRTPRDTVHGGPAGPATTGA